MFGIIYNFLVIGINIVKRILLFWLVGDKFYG